MTKQSPSKFMTAMRWCRKRMGAAAVVLLLIVMFVSGYLLGRGPTIDSQPADGEKHAGHQHDDIAKSQATDWICSMHPQIRKKGPGTCPICQMALTPATGGSSAGGMRRLAVTPEAARLMEIQTSPVERRFVEAEVTMVGKIDYDETRLGDITAYVGGRLDRLYVDYTGVAVKTGQHMVELYSPELIAAQEELIQSLGAVKALQDSDVGIVRETAQSTVVAVREKLRLWGLTPGQIAEIEARGKPTDHVQIKSPLSGIVIHKNAQEGMYVKTGTRIYTIADLTQLWVKFDAYESDLMWLRFGQPVEFSTEAYAGEVFRGQIAFIDPILDDARRTVKVRVNVSNEGGRLKPGMFVRGMVRAKVAMGGRVMDRALAGKWISPMHPEIIKDKPGLCDICGMPLVKAESLGYVSPQDQPNAKPLVVPASAVLVTGKRAIVYVKVPEKIAKTKQPTFEGREIVLGPRAGDYYIVRSNLREGELVVTKGNFKLDSELQLQAKPSMMAPQGGGGGGHDHGDHGSGKKANAGSTSGNAMVAPKAVHRQWQGVERAHSRLTLAMTSGDLQYIHRRFRELKLAFADVDRDKFTGLSKAMWDELVMRLINDVVEGVHAANIDEATKLLTPLNSGFMDLKKQFALGGHQSHDTHSDPLPPLPTSPAFAKATGKILGAYFVVSDSLATDDDDKAKSAALELRKTLATTSGNSLTPVAREAWTKIHDRVNSALGALLEAKDIKARRNAFLPLSNAMTQLAIQFGDDVVMPVYTMHCPMAFGNKGGSWLQSHRKVTNPYYGSSMLRCGDVTGTLSFAPQRASQGNEVPDGDTPLPKAPSPPTQSKPAKSPAPSLQGVNAVAASYFVLSDALVKGKIANAKTAIARFGKALSDVKVNTKDEVFLTNWRKARDSLRSSNEAMSKASTLEGMRLHFATLSEEMASVVKGFGGSDSPVYRVRCPMAFNNRGATWLQQEKKVANPYFGDRMLRCGSVIETLPATPAPAPAVSHPKGHKHD